MENRNTISFNDFKSKKKIGKRMNETVVEIDDTYRVMGGKGVEIPASLINAYVKKVKDETGQDIKQLYSEMALAEIIVDYVTSNFVTIENIPVSMVLGSDYKGAVKAQAQGQGQPMMDEFGTIEGQPQGQPQGQGQPLPQPQGQGQPQGGQPPLPQPQGQPTPQKTAAQIPPQSI